MCGEGGGGGGVGGGGFFRLRCDVICHVSILVKLLG